MADSLLIGSVTNGEYKKTTASQEATKSNDTTSTSKTASKDDNGYNKEMFLQLLVAEMQYQDPLQPTDNSQYVAQLASFTQIEAIQSVQQDMKTIQANSLVGQVVALTDDDYNEIAGKVEYVRTDDDGTMYASVNQKEYELDKIESVVEESFYNAKMLANSFVDAVEKLPTAEQLTLGDEEKVANATVLYNSLDDYSRKFIEDDVIKYFQTIYARFGELMKAKEASEKENETTSETSDDSSEETTVEAVEGEG